MSESLKQGMGTQGAPTVAYGGRWQTNVCVCVCVCVCVRARMCVCLINSCNMKHHLSISSNSVAVGHSQVITTVHFQKFSIFPTRFCPTEP